MQPISLEIPDNSKYFDTSLISDRVFFVNSNIGSDYYGDGSDLKPWATLNYAIQQLSAGDKLKVEGNFISEGDILIYNLNYVSIEATTMSRVSRVRLVNCKNVNVSGFSVRGLGPSIMPPEWEDMPNTVINNNVTINPRQSWFFRRRRVRKKYSTWFELADLESSNGSYAGGIELSQCARCRVENNLIMYNTYGVKITDETFESIIVNNTFKYNLDAIHFHANNGFNYSALECKVTQNSIQQSFRYGVFLGSMAASNFVVRNNVKFTGHNHICTYDSGTNYIAYNNVSHGGYYSETMKSPGSSAISLHSATYDTMALGNTIMYHIDPTGIDGNGIIIDYAKSGNIVANNLIIRCQGSGVSLMASSGCAVVHNTIVEVGQNVINEDNGFGVRVTDDKSLANIIANNIIWEAKHGGILLKSTSAAEQHAVDYNNVYSSEPLYYYFTQRVGGQYQTYLSAILNNSIVDPMFADTHSGLYHLKENSPLRGKGDCNFTAVLDLMEDVRTECTPGAIM